MRMETTYIVLDSCLLKIIRKKVIFVTCQILVFDETNHNLFIGNRSCLDNISAFMVISTNHRAKTR